MFFYLVTGFCIDANIFANARFNLHCFSPGNGIPGLKKIKLPGGNMISYNVEEFDGF